MAFTAWNRLLHKLSHSKLSRAFLLPVLRSGSFSQYSLLTAWWLPDSVGKCVTRQEPNTRISGSLLWCVVTRSNMGDSDMMLFMCTNYKVQITMIFRCYGPKPRIFQLFPVNKYNYQYGGIFTMNHQHTNYIKTVVFYRDSSMLSVSILLPEFNWLSKLQC